MIHLDTNLLIAITQPNDPQAPLAAKVMRLAGPFGASACAWTEFHSRPLDPTREMALRRILSGGILPFNESTAVQAGQLFRASGSKRRTRLDSMIAATAILAGAELATTNPADFQPFVPLGLRLIPL